LKKRKENEEESILLADEEESILLAERKEMCIDKMPNIKNESG